MSLRFLSVVWLASVSVGCASNHYNHKAKHSGGEKIEGLVLSAQDLTGTTKEPFTMIAMSFENTTGDWLRIEKAEVVIGKDLADKVSVVLGQDLVDWAAAMEARAAVEKHNRQMTQLGLAFAGAALVAASGDGQNDGALVGATTYSAVQGWVIYDLVKWSKLNAENPKSIPQNHIQRSFSVPGKLFMRRWVLLNNPIGTRITEVPVKITFVDGRTTTMMVNLKKEG